MRALGDEHFRYGETVAVTAGAGVGPWKRVSAGLAVVVAAMIMINVRGWVRPETTAPVSRQHILLGNVGIVGDVEFDAAVAPDGSSIVFSDNVDGVLQLKRKLRGEPGGVALTGTEGARTPFFSP